ncbi:MAG: glycosyltransferase [Chitinispirillaceae bacterium]|nr:glycosyltransferase [Chitinispirillaceae bacterium]
MKVSVVMITFNHEAYISKAIESVLEQQGNFEVELTIGEDCSTDNTRNIIMDYVHKYPKKIKTLFHPINVGPQENFICTYNIVDGDYIAILEGDDYWIDPFKLSKQIEFLEKHPEVSFTFHNVYNLYQNNGRKEMCYPPNSIDCFYTISRLLEGNFIPTCSVVYRRKNVPIIPEWFKTLPMCDWPLHILHAEKGSFGYIDEVMGVYRITETSLWAERSLEYRLEKSIHAAIAIDKFLNYKYTSQLKKTIIRWYNELIDISYKERDPLKAFEYVLKSLEYVNEIIYHTNYVGKYLALFFENIIEFIQKGDKNGALGLYYKSIDKIPFIMDDKRLESIMGKLHLKRYR